MTRLVKSNRLKNVHYDIRGPLLQTANKLEKEGHKIIKLNIGNPTPFGIYTNNELHNLILSKLQEAEGYTDSKGMRETRECIANYCIKKGITNVDVAKIYTGNGASELIMMSLQGLLNNKDEVLVPAPDYPLWTAAVNFASGRAVHYLCDEKSDWNPDIKDIKSKITSKTKGIVIINPNNPTGANYSKETLLEIIKIARKNKLLLFSDETYDRTLYDGARHTSTGALAKDVPIITFNGLSKSHCICGYRAGWMAISGNTKVIKEYIEGIDVMSSMRLCSNVPAQYAIQFAFKNNLNLDHLLKPGGRLFEQREVCINILNNIPGVTCVKPKAAFYMFPKLDKKIYKIKDDRKFALDFLIEHKVLIINGRGFNWPEPDHFRIVYLPDVQNIKTAMTRFSEFLASKR